MDPVVGALIRATVALGNENSSKEIRPAYEALKGLITTRFGRGAVIDALEEAPESASARHLLTDALEATGATDDAEVLTLAEALDAALTSLEPDPGRADIHIGEVNAYRNAILRGMHASGRISIERLEARHGDAIVEHALVKSNKAVWQDPSSDFSVGHMSAGRDVIIQYGLSSAPSGYKARIRNLIRDYLGDPGSKKAFGGRDKEIERLNQWASHFDAAPNMLLSAPAGRGKTALLVRWLAQWPLDYPKIYLPISIRYGTEPAHIFYEALATSLGELADAKQGFSPISDRAEFFKEQSYELLELLRIRQSPFLLVIDGLDEACGWTPDDSFLSSSHQMQKVLVSARIADGGDSQDYWLTRLGWRGSRKADTLSLPRLHTGDVADILSKAGIFLDRKESQRSLAEQLARLSEGDPLTLEYLVDDISHQPLHDGLLDDEQLRRIDTGFKGYFANWLERQRPLWNDTKNEGEQTVVSILAVLACALGPLTNRDLSELIRRAFRNEVIITDQTLRPLRRFLVGNFHVGFTLAHPRLSQYFIEDFFQNGTVIERVRQAYLYWVLASLDNLESKTLLPKDVPSYLVNHAARQLIIGGAQPSSILRLANVYWRDACRESSGDEYEYVRHIQLVLTYLARRKKDTSKVCSLASLVRCALSSASIMSIAHRVPIEMVGICAAEEIISIRAATDSARARGAHALVEIVSKLHLRIPVELRDALLTEALTLVPQLEVSGERVETYLRLSHLVEPSTAKQIEALAFAEVDRTSTESSRAQTLTSLAIGISDDRKTKLTIEALDAIDAIENNYGMSVDVAKQTELARLAPCLSAQTTPKALKIARGMRVSRLDAVLCLAPHIEAEDLWKEITEALLYEVQAGFGPIDKSVLIDETPDIVRVIKAFDHPGRRARLIAGIANKVQGDLLLQIYQIAADIREQPHRAIALIALAALLPTPSREEAIAEAFNVATNSIAAVDSDFLRKLAELATPEQLDELVLVVARVEDLDTRANAFRKLSQFLSRSQLKHALSALQRIDGDFEYSRRLLRQTQIAARLHSTDRELIIDNVLENLDRIKRAEYFARAIEDIAPHAPLEYTSKMLIKANLIEDPIYRSRGIEAIARHLTAGPQRDNAIESALSAAETIEDSYNRSAQLGYLQDLLTLSQVNRAFKAIAQIENENQRLEGWVRLAPRLSQSDLDTVFRQAVALNDHDERLVCLLDLLPHLPPETVSEAKQLALGFLKESSIDFRVTNRLTKIARFLSDEELEWWIRVIENITDPHMKVEWSLAIAPYLPDVQRQALISASLAMGEDVFSEYSKQRIFGTELIKIFTGLSTYANEQQLTELINILCRIEFLPERAEALHSFLARTSGPIRKRIIDEIICGALAVRAGSHFASLAEAAWPFITNRQKETLLTSFLLQSHRRGRADYVEALPSMIELIAEQEGDPGLLELSETIEDVAAMFP